MQLKLIYVLCFFIFGVSLISCYEREEGCLDNYASDFAITADDGCDDCCTYPTISFQISHKLGDVTYGYDSIVVNDFGQEVKLNRAIFFLSDFQLELTEGEPLVVLETSEYETLAGEFKTRREDHVLIQQSTRNVTIGTVREVGLIDIVHCQVGVSHNDIALEDDVVLYEADSLFQESQYIDILLYLKTGDLFEDDVVVKITNVTQNNLFFQDVINVDKLPRQSVKLDMYIDYIDLLRSIDLAGNTGVIKLKEFEIPQSFLKFEL